MKTVKTLTIAGALLLGGAAYAKKNAPQAQPPQPKPNLADVGSVSGGPGLYAKSAYPSPYVQRPLVLPQGMAQADSMLAISNYPSQTGSSMNLGVDVGLRPRLEAGLLLGLPLTPDGGFGMLVGNVQYAVASFTNLRFDIGASKLAQKVSAMGNTTTTETATGFVWGLGLPMKWRLADRVALTTGRSNASAFGGASKVNGYLTTSDDIVTMASGSFPTMTGNGISSTIWTFGLPVGVLAQVHDRIGMALRTGFRVMRGDGIADDTAIPLALDLMTRVTRPLDLGFTFELPGWTSDYGAIKNVNLWAQARF